VGGHGQRAESVDDAGGEQGEGDLAEHGQGRQQQAGSVPGAAAGQHGDAGDHGGGSEQRGEGGAAAGHQGGEQGEGEWAAADDGGDEPGLGVALRGEQAGVEAEHAGGDHHGQREQVAAGGPGQAGAADPGPGQQGEAADGVADG